MVCWTNPGLKETDFYALFSTSYKSTPYQETFFTFWKELNGLKTDQPALPRKGGKGLRKRRGRKHPSEFVLVMEQVGHPAAGQCGEFFSDPVIGLALKL